jgi:hypothetical protein
LVTFGIHKDTNTLANIDDPIMNKLNVGEGKLLHSSQLVRLQREMRNSVWSHPATPDAVTEPSLALPCWEKKLAALGLSPELDIAVLLLVLLSPRLPSSQRVRFSTGSTWRSCRS